MRLKYEPASEHQVFEDDLASLGDEETLGNTSDNAIREVNPQPSTLHPDP